MPFHTNGIFSQIPKAFASLLPLSSMDVGATLGMVFGNKTLKEVTEEEAEARFSPQLPMDPLSPSGMDDPYVADDVLNQIENPDTLMSNISPEDMEFFLSNNPGAIPMIGLNPSERVDLQKDADSIIDGGVFDWLGDIWDAALDIPGDTWDIATQAVDSIFDQSEVANAEMEGMEKDPIGDFLGLFATPVYADEGEGSPVAPVDEENWWDPILQAGQDIWEEQKLVTSKILEDIGSLGTWAGEQMPELVDPYGNPILYSGALTPAGFPSPTGPISEEQRALNAREELEKILIPDVDDNYYATSRDIVGYIFSFLASGDFTEDDVTSFIGDKDLPADLEDSIYSAINVVDLYQRALEYLSPGTRWPSMDAGPDTASYLTPERIAVWLTMMGDESPPPKHPFEFRFSDDQIDIKSLTLNQMTERINQSRGEGTDVSATEGTYVSPPEVAEGADGIPTVEKTGVEYAIADPQEGEPNFFKIFQEALEETPYASNPEVRRRAESGELSSDAKLLFYLHDWKLLADKDSKTIEELFGKFLSHDKPVDVGDPTLEEDLEYQPTQKSGYLWNPGAFRRGPVFTQKITELKTALNDVYTNPIGFASLTQGIASVLGNFIPFEDGGSEYGVKNLIDLAKINYTGGYHSYESERMWNSSLRDISFRLNRGDSPLDIFNEYTSGTSGTTTFMPSPVSTPRQYDLSRAHALMEREFPTVSEVPDIPDTAQQLPDSKPDVRYIPKYDFSSSYALMEREFPTVKKKAEDPKGERIPPEILSSMPYPFDDEQAALRDQGLPYLKGRWIGGEDMYEKPWEGEWVRGEIFTPKKAVELLTNGAG